MNLKRFWPWKQLAKLEELEIDLVKAKKDADFLRGMQQATREEAARLRLQLAQAVKELDEHKELVITKDQQMRKLGVILAMKGGIALLCMLCLSLFAQPLQRQPFSTNTGPLMDAATFTVSNLTQVLDNTGDIIGPRQITSFGIITNGSSFWTNRQIRTLNGSSGELRSKVLLQHLQPSTNQLSQGYVGHYFIGGGEGASGACNFLDSPDYDNGNLSGLSITLDAFLWATNAAMADLEAFGCLPGYGNILTNTKTSPKIDLDNSLFIGGDAGAFRLSDEASVSIGTSSSLACLVSAESFFLGGGAGGDVQHSTNDIWIGFSGGNHSGTGWDSAENIIFGSSTLPHTSGNTNFVVGSGLDLPVNNQNGQINILNLLWGAGGTSETGNTPTTSGTLTFNGFGIARQELIATNGFASYATNIQSAISNLGFTNDVAHGWGTNNMIVDIITVGETVAFYNRSGAQGQTSCGTLLFTDTGIANKEYNVGVNCGVTFSVGTFTSGTARAF